MVRKYYFLSFLIFSFLFMFLQGCGAIKFYDTSVKFNEDKTKAIQSEEFSSWGVFGPTYQLTKNELCNVKKTHKNSPNSFGDGYESYEVTDCHVITKADGYVRELGTPTGPPFLQAGAAVGTGALIKEGLENQPQDNISNSNQQGQYQGQKQYQRQYQKQYQYQRKGGGYR